MSKLDDILNDADWTEAMEQPWTAREKIKALIKDIIGHKIRSRFDDDYGGRKFTDGYNQAKSEQLKRLEKL